MLARVFATATCLFEVHCWFTVPHSVYLAQSFEVAW